MTMLTTAHAGHAGRLDLAGLLRTAASALRRRMRIAADRRLLESMPDYLLHDLGITRGEIGDVTEHGRLARR